MRKRGFGRGLAPGLFLTLLAGCASTGGVDRHQAAQANADVGAEYLRRNDNDRAMAAFQRALDYDRHNFNATWGQAVASDRLSQTADARRYFEKALAIRDAPVVDNSYAAFLCRHGDTKKGVAYFERALDTPSATDRADTLANAGLCLMRAEQPEAAQAYFDRALAADPTQATALTQQADIAYHAQNYMKARAFVERADSATTLGPDELRLAAQIESALNDPRAAESYRQRYQAHPAGGSPPTPVPREPSQP